VPHKFKSRTVTVASVVIIFSTPYALRVSCKIDGFRSKDIYCLSIIMNNNNELYCYPFPLLQVIGVFSPPFHVTSSIQLYDNLSSSFNSQCLLTYSFIPTPYQPSPRFFAFVHVPFNLSVCALQFPPPTISSNLQSTCLTIPHSFFWLMMFQFIFLVFHFRNDQKVREMDDRLKKNG